MDAALRSVYRELAEHPERGDSAASLLTELIAERRCLAVRVGESVLERSREVVSATQSSPVPTEHELVETPAGAAPPAPPVDPPPPASPDAVCAFQEKFAARSPFVAEPSSAILLHDLLERAGAPPSETGGAEEIDRLVDVVTEETMATLLRLDKEVQRTYLAMITARVAAERAAGDPFPRERLYDLLATIREFSMRERPGAIHGLKRDHEPRYGSWLLDAAQLWQRLGGDVPALVASSRSSGSRPRRAAPAEHEPEMRAPPESWPLWPIIRGTAALMIGGEPRETSRARIERAFQLRELVWIADDPRKVDSAVTRVEAHGFDVVLILSRFVSHPSSERLVAACASSNVRWAHVERGYGIEQIRAALERFLSSPQARQAR
jgi:hypothetical protein